MNKTRRRQLNGLHCQLLEIMSNLQDLLDEEQTALDNMPESLQETERASLMDLAIGNMDAALSAFDEAEEYIAEILA